MLCRAVVAWQSTISTLGHGRGRHRRWCRVADDDQSRGRPSSPPPGPTDAWESTVSTLAQPHGVQRGPVSRGSRRSRPWATVAAATAPERRVAVDGLDAGGPSSRPARPRVAWQSTIWTLGCRRGRHRARTSRGSRRTPARVAPPPAAPPPGSTPPPPRPPPNAERPAPGGTGRRGTVAWGVTRPWRDAAAWRPCGRG
jgi:hypothetical protein